MRLSPERIRELKKLLKELYDLDYTDEETQEAGLAMMRFVLAKEQRRREKETEKDSSDSDLVKL